MTDDRMHERLVRAGQDWRAAQPPVHLDPATAAHGGNRTLVYAAVAAAVLAVAGGGWALGNTGGDPRPASPAHSLPTPAPGVVPWKNLAPTHVSTPADLRSCSADDLHVTPSIGGAAGTAYLDVEISGTDDPCRLEGSPGVALLDHGQQILAYRSQVGDLGTINSKRGFV